MEREQFTFYASFAKAISRIKKKSARCAAYEAIIQYALYGETPDYDKIPSSAAEVFREFQSLVDLDRRSAVEIRRSTEYKEWRKAVFARDDYTCQHCGARGVKINAHHIKPFAWYPDLRTDVNNGITLCVKCHKAVHHGA